MTMRARCNSISTRRLAVAVILFVMITVGCTSTTKTKQAAASKEMNAVNAREAVGGPGIDLNCVMDHIQNPPEAFHYSYIKQSDNPVEEQADITPQVIDGMF